MKTLDGRPPVEQLASSWIRAANNLRIEAKRGTQGSLSYYAAIRKIQTAAILERCANQLREILTGVRSTALATAESEKQEE